MSEPLKKLLFGFGLWTGDQDVVPPVASEWTFDSTAVTFDETGPTFDGNLP